MGIFDFLKKKIPIDFSDENLSELTLKSDFRKLVISRELFGGAGALWEIHIENPTEYRKFNKQFCEYLDLILKMGIKHRALKQTRKLMPKLN